MGWRASGLVGWWLQLFEERPSAPTNERNVLLVYTILTTQQLEVTLPCVSKSTSRLRQSAKFLVVGGSLSSTEGPAVWCD